MGSVPPEASLLSVWTAVLSRCLTGSSFCACLCPGLPFFQGHQGLP